MGPIARAVVLALTVAVWGCSPAPVGEESVDDASLPDDAGIETPGFDASAIPSPRTPDASAQSLDARPPTGGATNNCPMLPRVDPATLPSCCTDGNARCVPSSFIPAQLSRLFGQCGTGGACVPDAIIRGGTSYMPRRCMSIGGADGRCMSICIPEVARNHALLPRADCADDERCAPCVNPLTGMSSGACDNVEVCRDAGAPTADGAATSDGASTTPTGDGGGMRCEHTGPPLLNPATFPACCPGAHCVPMALVPVSFRSQLAQCPGGFCTPDVAIASGGRFTPPTCRSFDVVEGRCLSACLPAVQRELARLAQGTCGPAERCVPCFDPFTGVSTGACTQACDTGPAEPSRTFPRCCGGRGQCVPPLAVPPGQRSSLARRDCPRDLVCAPLENLDPNHRPATCGAVNRLTGRAYPGVCVSNCADFGFLGFLTLEQGSCASGYTCAPCVNPLTNRPTGAPGC